MFHTEQRRTDTKEGLKDTASERNNKMVDTILWPPKVWLVVGDSGTSVSVRRRARLPGPGHQNISNAAWRERNHVRRTGEVGDK